MYSAPAVSYPVGRSRDAARLLILLWLLGACCAGIASWQLDGRAGWRQGLLLASVVLAGLALALHLWRQAASADLRFDGQGWALSSGAVGQAARLAVVLDLQSLMLVRWAGPGRPQHWLWLARRTMPQRWADLRRAVYSRAPSTDPASGAP